MIRFQAYFKKGLRYLSGGVKTGLSHYVEDKNPKLFHVKVIVSIFTITNIKLKSIYYNPTTSHACSVYRDSHCVHVHVAGAKEANCPPVYGDLLGGYEQVSPSSLLVNLHLYLAEETLMCWTCRCRTRC